MDAEKSAISCPENDTMQSSIAAILELIHTKISAIVDTKIHLAAPDDRCPVVYIFPIHFTESPLTRNTPDSESSAREGLCNQPALALENMNAQIHLSSLALDELVGVFLSSGISLRLAIGFKIQISYH